MDKINKNFDLPWERIDEICATNQKLALYINTIVDFSSWVSNNLADLEIETWYSIYEEFIQNNQDLIEKINKIRFSPSSSGGIGGGGNRVLTIEVPVILNNREFGRAVKKIALEDIGLQV